MFPFIGAVACYKKGSNESYYERFKICSMQTEFTDRHDHRQYQSPSLVIINIIIIMILFIILAIIIIINNNNNKYYNKITSTPRHQMVSDTLALLICVSLNLSFGSRQRPSVVPLYYQTGPEAWLPC